MNILLAESELISAHEFRYSHRCKRNSERALQITLRPTGIADKVEAKCLACGRVKDVSDYSTWLPR